MQQTRVDQGLPYYQQFVDTYPTIHDLAKADEQDVLRIWQGLGYYSRARNLHATAKFITDSLVGVFPNTYQEILKLKGVGPYTAAAIASICFNEPTPVVDGNVFRFASRYFGIKEDISKSKSRRAFEAVLSNYISKDQPASFNQGMMEYGATICSPSPHCPECVFQFECIAFQNNLQNTLPINSKKTKVRHRVFHYLVIRDETHFLLKQRGKNDVWAHMYDFYSLEGEMEEEDVLKQFTQTMEGDFQIQEISNEFFHVLSHQKIQAKFYQIKVPREQMVKSGFGQPYSEEEIVTLPKPKLIVNYLASIGIKS